MQVWRYLVLDEGHKVKNEETRISDGMRHIARQQVLMLTGTPVQVRAREESGVGWAVLRL